MRCFMKNNYAKNYTVGANGRSPLRNKIILTILILFAGILTLQAQEVKQNDFFPLTKGNYWMYKLSNNVLIRSEVADPETKDGVNYSVIISYPSQDYKNAQKEYFLPQDDGIYYYGKIFTNLNVIYDPVIKKIPADLTKPQAWEWTGLTSKVKTIISAKTSGPEPFILFGNKFQAYKVTQTVREAAQTDLTKKIVVTEWYVKDIGKVKETDEFFAGKEYYILTAELDSYNVK